METESDTLPSVADSSLSLAAAGGRNIVDELVKLKIVDEYGTSEIVCRTDDDVSVQLGYLFFHVSDVYMDRLCRLWKRYREMKGNG